MSMIIVREADPHDTESIVSLITAPNDQLNYPVAEPMDSDPEIAEMRVKARIAADDLSVVVATINSEIVGTGYLTEEGHISATYVKTPEPGVAKALIKARIQKAKDLGLTYITMAVDTDNQKLLKLAQKMGFTLAGVNEPHHLVMIKQLT